MPIVPPGSVYSPGDDIARSLMMIGQGLPGIIDPRRGQRERAMELLSDPDKIKPIAKRIRAQATTIGPDGTPFLDPGKMDQAVRDVAVSMGLRPDNEREFAVVKPAVEAAVAAIPVDEQVQIELGAQEEFRSKLRKREEQRVETETQQLETQEAQADFAGTYVYEALGLGIGPQKARNEFAGLQTEEDFLNLQDEYTAQFETLLEQDPTLAGILASGGREAAAEYLMRLRLQAIGLASRIRAGASPDVDATDRLKFINERQAALRAARQNILELSQSDNVDRSALQVAIDDYNSVKEDYLTLAEEFGVPVEQMPSTPYIREEQDRFLGLIPTGKSLKVGWRNSTLPAADNVPNATHQSNFNSLRSIVISDPAKADEALSRLMEIEGSQVEDIFDDYNTDDALRLLQYISEVTGVPMSQSYISLRRQRGVLDQQEESPPAQVRPRRDLPDHMRTR